jgi:hypothetical protein
MQGIFQKENTDKALKYGIYRHLPTYEKIIRNLVSFSYTNSYITLIPSQFVNEYSTVPSNGTSINNAYRNNAGRINIQKDAVCT